MNALCVLACVLAACVPSVVLAVQAAALPAKKSNPILAFGRAGAATGGGVACATFGRLPYIYILSPRANFLGFEKDRL